MDFSFEISFSAESEFRSASVLQPFFLSVYLTLVIHLNHRRRWTCNLMTTFVCIIHKPIKCSTKLVFVQDCLYITGLIPDLVIIGFLPARRYASAGNSDRNVSVCPPVRLSVRLSVTRRYCVKTKKASDMISSPSGSRKTLVFWRQISSPNSKGFPRTGASKKGRSEKFSDFLALSVNTCISKTVADTVKDYY